MDVRKCVSSIDGPLAAMAPMKFANNVRAASRIEEQEEADDLFAAVDVDVDIKEVYYLILHFLSSGPCQKTFRQLLDELLEYELLPRRYHAWYSRDGGESGHRSDDGISFPLNYDSLIKRFPHIENDHLVKLLRQLMLKTSPPLHCIAGRTAPGAADVPTLLGTGNFSLLKCDRTNITKQSKKVPSYLRWPHMQSGQVRGLGLREIGGGFPKHHRAPSIRFASYAVAKPSTMLQKMQNIKKLRGHRDAVYCAIFDRSGRYVITGSDDRLVKIWSMETAFCLSSCRGHEGDITDLAVSSNNFMVASASNDFSIRVWRLPDGCPVSVLRGHTGAVTAIAFSPRPDCVYQLLSSSDDGTCRIWDARNSSASPRIYLPRPVEIISGKTSSLPLSNVASSSNTPQGNQILCCAYNANGTVFVTGSSDTHARVWSAFKSSSDDPEKPIHEIDLLSGHENDVNYVQFSGCAVAPRYSTSDMVEEKGPKFKNSWFSHDNIVTCSRDGSAIIWAPKSHRTQGKMGRWVRAYHLKVPPPPMPPQPPRGGPRQRFLPTPRGVNMIVWSLDNRFVLAAIMDCRICVWNASDGSLVHSLTGHTASTYVLDIHPFNPRIAMSAGYDGKTIVWDIWEGIPIWTYEIGRFKLVDGKFSQDGTSIVLSDEVGQIYFLNTGQGESQKDAKYDQFFLGDYRPLVRDTYGSAIDEETQLLPYQRNIQDRLCDSSMLPYPEPYQSTYQRRRLGAMKIEFRPSTIKLAVGTDIGLGQEYQILPDLDLVVDPLPDFADALYWEPPENEVIRDETDSEYLVTDGNSSEEEGKEHSSDLSVSDPECSEAIHVGRSQKDGLRRSKRKKTSSDADFLTTGRRMKKKKKISESEGPSTRSKKTKKRRNGRKYSSRRKSTEGKLIRPQRLAAQNAVNGFYQASKFSTDEEVEESLEDDSSGADSSAEGKEMKKNRVVHHLRKEKQKIIDGEKGTYSGSDTIKFPEQNAPSKDVGNRKRLVLKFTMRKPEPSLCKDKKTECDNQSSTASFYQSDLGPSSICETQEPLDRCQETRVDSREVRVCTESQMELGYPVAADDSHPGNGSIKVENESMNPSADLESGKHKLVINKEKQVSEASELEYVPSPKISAIFKLKDAEKSSINGGPSDRNIVNVGEHSKSPTSDDILADSKNTAVETNEIQKPKVTIIKIKPTRMMQDSATVNDPASSNGNLHSEYPYLEDQSPASSSEEVDDTESSDASSDSASDEDEPSELPDVATDAVRRKRSLRLKATTRERDVMSQTHGISSGYNVMGSWTDNPPRRALDSFPSRGMPMSIVIPRSSRSRVESYFGEDRSALARRNLQVEQRKSNWLLLTEQEEGYRYVPQLRDEVVYLRQGHQESFESGNRSRGSPWVKYRNMRPVEACSVEELDYSTIAGSGEGGCEITFRFIDSSSEYFGQKFKLTLPELVGSPDFIVERTWYEASVNRNWSLRDKCSVWWKDDSEEGGCWWDGRVVSVEDKSAEFPNSPWERYTVRYKSETESSSRHSPWELHDLDKKFEQPCIDPDARDSLLVSFNRLLETARRNQDNHGLLKLQEVCQKKDFINKFPVPLSPEIIKLRLEFNYYRALDSVEHDVEVMIRYARSYFGRSRDLVAKMDRLSEWFKRKISKL